MATPFNPILPSEVAPDAPLTASLALRWSQNLAGALEGSGNGAPTLLRPALGSVAAGDVLLSVLVPNSLPDSLTLTNPTGSTSTISGGKILELAGVSTIANAGVIRIRGTVAGAAATKNLNLFRNGSLVSTVTGTFIVDLSVSAGDELYFTITAAHSLSGGATLNGAVTIQNLRVLGDTGRLWRV